MGEWERGAWNGPRPTVDELLGTDDDQACHCCRSKGVKLRVFDADGDFKKAAINRGEPPFIALCKLCSGSMVGVMAAWREQYDHAAVETMKLVCFVGNEILKRLPAAADVPRKASD